MHHNPPVPSIHTSLPAPGWRPNDLSRSSAVDYVLDNSTVIFAALRKMGSMTGIPYLGEAANVALRIVNLAKATRNNSDAYMELAKDVCGLVYTILNECQEMEQNHQAIPQRLENHIRGLIRNLNDIQKFIELKITRNSFQKLMNASRDIDQITRYREQLRQSLDIFGIQTNISTQQNLQQIAMNIQQQREEMRADRLRHEEQERFAREELASQQEEIRVALLRQSRQDRLEAEQHAQQEARRKEHESEREAKRLQREEQAQQEARRRERESEKEAKRLQREEDRATRMEILRVEEEDFVREQLEIEESIRKENRKKEAKEARREQVDRLKREIEELKRQQARQSDSQQQQQQLHYRNSPSPHHSPYLAPAPSPYLSPYGYAPHSVSAPYLAAPPTPYQAHGSVSLSNIHNSSISLGNTSVMNHNYINSGNVTTTTISNCFNTS